MSVMKPKTSVGLPTRILENLKKYPEGYPPDFARAYVIGKFTYPIGLFGHTGFLVMFWILDLQVLAAFNVLSVAIFSWAIWQHWKGNMKWPILLVSLFELPVHAILATLFVGTFSAFWVYILISMSILVLAPFLTRKFRYITCFALSLIMISIVVFGKLTAPLQIVSVQVEFLFFAINIINLTFLLTTLLATFDLAVARAEKAFQLEFSRAETLLLNILPAAIATRLKAQEEPLADSHDSVSVLFADLAGFTDLSRKMSAAELVTLLNDLFSRFDRLVQEHGAEKIKTIGDAYMVATGLSGSAANHAEQVADLALGMQKAFGEFREQNQVDLKLRIGVHSGAVIAGVIGQQKFAYDLWGDTVNIASRMESEGLPDQIQISAETWNLIHDRFVTSSRGQIEIKGHSPRVAYLLESHTVS